MAELRAPFIWFGGKRRVAEVCWRAFGNVPNYVEAFAATCAVLLARPGGAGKIETINDLDCDIANFWRAVIADPAAVAAAADWPINEADLHARGKRLQETLPAHREKMHADPDYFDLKRAGWWVWGVCSAVGHGWMRDSLPSLGHSGRGIHRNGAPSLISWFKDLSRRLRRVRVACGDFERVLAGSVTGASNTLQNMGMGPCGVLLDPVYPGMGERLYRVEDSGSSARACAWAIANGDNPHFRIALCGYAGDYDMPANWTEHAWKEQGGFANGSGENENASRERIYFSPHCLPIDQQRSLFEVANA